ncbi:hypothetical protein FNF28_06692 [Cafeteria roenbergensis]|uniref:Uncharacterized protein n=1 Tax=Cafeteria roenbergensis TaxID=33653 RepID=A0A5A8CS65_CAFRO|nr:hypothetical protein FNF28_06692 [Cafeteria roenbergensis]
MPRGVVSLSLAVRSATESCRWAGDPVAIAESGIALSPDSVTFTPNNSDVPVFVEATSTSDCVVGAVRPAQIAASVAAPRDPEYDSLPELSRRFAWDDVEAGVQRPSGPARWQTEQTFTVTVANDDVARDYVAALVVTATARGVGSGAQRGRVRPVDHLADAVNLAVENDDDAEIVISSLAAPAVSVPVGGSLELSIFGRLEAHR